MTMRVLLALLLFAATEKNVTLTLDAAEKHIVKSPYHADQAVALSGPAVGGWHVYAGAAIDAGTIDLRLRNVHGQVRFRADSTRLQQTLNRWTTAGKH